MSDNYYDVLGVPMDATDEAIKKAYYKLARENHPDVSGEPSKDFRAISEAYNTLNDKKKRSDYDLTIKIPSAPDVDPLIHSFFGNMAPQLPVLKVTLNVSVKDAINGTHLNLVINVPAAQSADPNCRWCGGTGQRVDNSSGFPKVGKCDCGKDEVGSVEVGMRIPRGARNGDTIDITDIPETLPYRKITVTLAVTPDNRYSQNGSKLTYTAQVTVLGLLLGTKKRIPFFEKFVTLDIPAGTSPYEKFEVEHAAYPEIKIKVKLNVTTPDLKEEQIEAIRAVVQD